MGFITSTHGNRIMSLTTFRGNNNPNREQDWPVRVFRQVAEGWERLRSKYQGRTIQIRAIPRKDCLVLPRLQIRVRIDASSETNRPTIIRRRRCLLIYSQQQRVRVLVLQFKNAKDCTTFTDHWINLNPQDPFISSVEQSLDEPVVQHYLFRLMHDPSFVQFCRKLSAHLKSQPDGLAALRAFEDDNDQQTAEEHPPFE